MVLTDGAIPIRVSLQSMDDCHIRVNGRKCAVEWGGTVFVGAVFLLLAVLGQRVWAGLHLSGGEPAPLVVEVVGEQFAWSVRYAGADGVFGRTDPRLYDPASNPLGLVTEDPAARDDIVSVNLMVVPVDRPIEVHLGSKDVLHSFFLPAMRIKQDTVPGLRVPLRFHPLRTGEFEIPCAELCGRGHYRMKGLLQVVTIESDGTRLVFKFELDAIEEQEQTTSDSLQLKQEHRRIIPTLVKLEVWKRYGGKCAVCGATNELHFDHIIPYSKGGTSLTADNIQLLCARHNLEKRDKIE